MEIFSLYIVVSDLQTNNVLIKLNAYMSEKECNKLLSHQLKIINKLKEYAKLNVKIEYEKL